MNAEDIIEKLNLRPHPEGGWYTETLSSDDENGGRSALSAIYFLLKEGETAHWHRIMDAAEIWSWHAGSALSPTARKVTMPSRLSSSAAILIRVNALR